MRLPRVTEGFEPSGDAERELYLDLMVRCLTGYAYAPERMRRNKDFLERPGKLFAGRWPRWIHTMVGPQRLRHLRYCVETVLTEGIPGDFLEAGAWRGGASIFVRAVLKAHGVGDRTVWVADSFEGFPAPDPDSYPADKRYEKVDRPDLAVSVEEVRANFDGYGLLDERVRFLKGYFEDTLPHAPVERLALLRLDGDMYQSTMDTLVHLYPKLSPGGFLIVDDYGALEPCKRAVHDYREDNGIREEIVPIDWTGVYWRRGR